MMRKLFLLVLVCVLAFTGCTKKEEPVKKLVWLTEADVTKAFFAAQEYRKETGVVIDVLATTAPDGTTSEIQAMFAAGAPPNVYSAYGGRVNAYYDIASPLTLELNQYVPGVLDTCKNSKGEIAASPWTFGVQGGSLNMTLVKKYGLEKYVPKNEDRTWTYADFDAMQAEFIAKKAKTEMGVVIFTGAGSGDYWVELFEKGWGGNPLYKNGKFDVNNPGMVAAWTWMKEAIAKGYAPAGAEGLDHTAFATPRNEGKLLFAGAGPLDAWASLFETFHCSYPSKDGSFVPFAVAPTSHIAIKVEDAVMDAKAKAFVEWLSSSKWVRILGYDGQYPSRIDVPELPKITDANKVPVAWAKKMLEKYGVMDMGLGKTQYQGIRTIRVKKLGLALAGKLTVEQALAEFQTEGDALFVK